MFSKRPKNEKPRVFLGTLAVVPRGSFKQGIEQWRWVPEEELDEKLLEKLPTIFCLPRFSSDQNALETDLGLDVFIAGLLTGEAIGLDIGEIGLPILWRPKVELRARLFNFHSGKAIKTFSVTEKATWREYLSRQFRPFALLRIGPVFSSDDLEILLNRASLKLLERAISTAYR